MQGTQLAQSSHKHTLCVGECPQYPSNGLHNCSDVLQLIPTYHHEPHFIARPTSKKIKCSPIRLIPHPKQICALPLLLRCCCGVQTPCPRRAAEVQLFPLFSCYFFLPPFSCQLNLAFAFFLRYKMCTSRIQRPEQRNTVTYILFNYVKRCITKSASKHLTNYTTRLQYIFLFFLFFCCVQIHSL